jgi:glycosyltransferase involved in cell wall biosynthesis
VKPDILRVLTRLGAGGPPIHAILLMRQMERYGYSTMLVAGRCDRADGDMSYLLGPDDSVCWIDEMSRAVSPWQDLCALVRLVRLMRRNRPSIVHTHTAKAGVLGRIAAKLTGVPVVVHTFHGHVLSHYFSPPVNWAIQMVERGLARWTDAICVLSQQQADAIADGYRIAPREKIRVVPLGMELSATVALPRAEDGQGLVAGWLGRLVDIKDIPLLIEVMRETARRGANVRFVIAGDGPMRALVEAAAAELGADRCQYLGWQRDISSVLGLCHLLIQTSRNEGTPVALIQGMAAGRPFVSTPAGGVVDMVSGPMTREADGCRWFPNAVLAPADPGAFASTLCALAANQEAIHEMGDEAVRFATASYGETRLLESLDRLYTELLEKKQVKQAPLPARA